MVCVNLESSAGASMEVSEAGDNFDLEQEEFGTLEMVDFEDTRFFLRRVGLVGTLL